MEDGCLSLSRRLFHQPSLHLPTPVAVLSSSPLLLPPTLHHLKAYYLFVKFTYWKDKEVKYSCIWQK